jgi:hypothetical protein
LLPRCSQNIKFFVQKGENYIKSETGIFSPSCFLQTSIFLLLCCYIGVAHTQKKPSGKSRDVKSSRFCTFFFVICFYVFFQGQQQTLKASDGEKKKKRHKTEREEMLNQSYHVNIQKKHGTCKMFLIFCFVRFFMKFLS